MKMYLTGLLLLLISLSASAQQNGPVVTVALHTNMGEIQLELYPEKAPATVENFLRYVRDGYFDDTLFHRVIPHFMIQGGGFSSDNQRKSTRESIQNEAGNGLLNTRGTIAMARTTDPHSATAQFFINVADNSNLDHTGTVSSRAWGYAVFGRVTSGMETVDAIRVVPTAPGDRPIEPVIIERAEVTSN